MKQVGDQPTGLAPEIVTTVQGIFSRSGEIWTLGSDGPSFALKDIKGLSYIQRLLQHPGQEFHALDILREPADAEPGTDQSALLANAAVSIGGLGDAGEMLDARAKEDYRRRLRELREELEEHRARGNAERAEKIETEIDFIVREISRAVGLGGRDRRAGSAAERARLNVTRAIKTALQKISEHDTRLGELLDRRIRTGMFCRYALDTAAPIDWRFSIDDRAPAPALSESKPDPLYLRPGGTDLLGDLEERTTFVGRDAERAALNEVLERARTGTGRVVMIAGAPGVGKTRIAAEFARQVAQKGILTFIGACYDRDDAVPFIPFVEMFESALAQAPDPQVFRDSLGAEAAEITRLMPQLRRTFPDIPPPMELPPEQTRRLLFGSVAQVLARTASNRPLLLLLDDLHWADEGTLSLLNHLARSISELPVMIIGTYRDNELDRGRALAKTLDEFTRLHVLTRINLRGLPENAVAAMLQALSGRDAPASLVKFIFAGTEGNPFFVEELFRHLMERGKLFDSKGELRVDFTVDDFDVPQSLRLVIGRRLARLSVPIQEMLGAAAVIGPSFPFELLEISTGIDPDELLDEVEDAERAGLIAGTAQHSEARFQFSHELVRQTVLAGISPPRLQRLHLAIASAIERLYSGALENKVNDLAHHFWRAGVAAEADKSFHYLALAARQALAQSAYEQAIDHSRNALQVLDRIPLSPARMADELRLLIAYGVALLATKGWYVPQVGSIYTRAHELCATVGDASALFSVLFGLWGFHLVRGHHSKARQYADQMLQCFPATNDDGNAVQAYWSSGCTRFFMGEFEAAHAAFDECIRRDDQNSPQALAFRFGQDPCMSSLCFDAMTIWILGSPDQADKRAQEALLRARKLAHPFSMTWCCSNLAMFYTMRGNFRAAEEVITEGLALAKENGFALYEVGILSFRIIGKAAQGNLEDLQVAARQARKSAAGDYELARTWARSAVAEALGNAGQIDAAVGLLTQSSALVERNQERYVESEIHRIGGELALKQSALYGHSDKAAEAHRASAERNFLVAMTIARRHKARVFELRAAISLGKLLVESGRCDEARQTLNEIYDRFTEGFESRELREAALLLHQLNPSS